MFFLGYPSFQAYSIFWTGTNRNIFLCGISCISNGIDFGTYRAHKGSLFWTVQSRSFKTILTIFNQKRSRNLSKNDKNIDLSNWSWKFIRSCRLKCFKLMSPKSQACHLQILSPNHYVSNICLQHRCNPVTYLGFIFVEKIFIYWPGYCLFTSQIPSLESRSDIFDIFIILTFLRTGLTFTSNKDYEF